MYKTYYILGVKVNKAIHDKYASLTYNLDGLGENRISLDTLHLFAHDDGIAKDLPEVHQTAKSIFDLVKRDVEKDVESIKSHRICPISIASAEPRECREDCALFVTCHGWDEGCCSIAAVAFLLDELNERMDEIADEVYPDATP